jgi:hypothetical protein
VSPQNNYGVAIAWPPAPPVLAEALRHFKRIQQTWRGTHIVRGIPEAQRPLYRMKIRAYDIFHGKKPWNPKANFSNFQHAPVGAFKDQQGEVLWTCAGEKMFPGGAKMVPRIIVVTSAQLYKLDKGKSKEGVPLTEVTKISLSHHDDSVVVVHNSGHRAHVLNLAGPAQGGNNNNAPAGEAAERYSGFVVVLTEAIKKAKGGVGAVEVEFVDTFVFNGAKKPGQQQSVTVGFQQAPVPNLYRKGKPSTFTYST